MDSDLIQNTIKFSCRSTQEKKQSQKNAINRFGFETERDLRQYAFNQKMLKEGIVPALTKRGRNLQRINAKRKNGGKE